MARGWAWAVCGLMLANAAGAATLTAEDAVKLALQKNSQIIGAEAGMLDARAGLYSSMTGLVPVLRGGVSRFNSITTGQKSSGTEYIGGVGFPYSSTTDAESHGTTPFLSGSWGLLNLATWSGYSSARNGMTAARYSRQATRNEVALATRRQFYEVVKAIRLAQVATGALHLARDDERRVHALFEVGSVSKSDLLKAQVRTAQSELDSLTGYQAVIAQRIALAQVLGLRETEMGDVDTVLTAEPKAYDEAALGNEAAKARPDVQAAEKELVAARASLNAARLARLPYVTASGQMQFKTKSRSIQTPDGVVLPAFESETQRAISASIALNWDLFDGFSSDARSASAHSRLMRAKDTRDALVRNLQSEVHQAVLGYREAVAREEVARRALESATENLKLTQEKYNVGSATILELIDAQVQLQRAQSDGVSALAAIRVAEAQIDRVRGHAE